MDEAHRVQARVRAILADNLTTEAVLYTDESKLYGNAAMYAANHDAVNHGAKEYGRGVVHTNTIEG